MKSIKYYRNKHSWILILGALILLILFGILAEFVKGIIPLIIGPILTVFVIIIFFIVKSKRRKR
ncbi:MAG TPA: hypothetical protein VMC80_02600 [Patescibacteria group bacterium]|nr:hypothetical protein [Patescibacteria group bacterium]